MIRHPVQPEFFLLDEHDALGDSLPVDLPAPHERAVREVFGWARDYLVRPHPDLGRPGPVCPFVSASLHHDAFLVTTHPGDAPPQPKVVEVVRMHRDWFLELAPVDTPAAKLKTILIAFPDLPVAAAPGIVDTTQAELKPSFVEHGIMLGQFHPLPPEAPGLWNPEFRPLRSPVPLLAIRHMVATDLPFLADDPRWVAAYTRRFGNRSDGRRRAETTSLSSAS